MSDIKIMSTKPTLMPWALLLATIITPIPAMAQSRSDDVVVMRRRISAPRPDTLKGTWTPVDWLWETSAQTCSDTAPQYQTYACMRDGKTVDDARCSGAKPRPTRTQQRYEGCSYAWELSNTGDWASTCSDLTTRPVSYLCQRSGGDSAPAPVDAAMCGQPKGTTETAANYAGCNYAWARRGTSAWSGDMCLATSTRTVDWGCQRSGGQAATAFTDASEEYHCVAATKPPATETGGGCLVINGSFDSGGIASGNAKVGGWSSRSLNSGAGRYDLVAGVSGKAAHIVANAKRDGGAQWLEQLVKMTAGTTYRLTFSYKTTGYTNQYNIPAVQLWNTKNLIPPSNSWTTGSVTVTVPSTGDGIVAFSTASSDYEASELWIDNVDLKVVQ